MDEIIDKGASKSQRSLQRKKRTVHSMITKRDFILHGTCFCEKYSKERRRSTVVMI